jgi:Phage protein
MSEMDPHDRIDMTGPWAGFGFQAGHLFTPEGHQLEPCDMVWWSLTCNIAREWRLMMEAARTNPEPRRQAAKARPADSGVIYLRDALRIRRERRLGVIDSGLAAEPSNVVYMRRGPRPGRRG